jgi:hypothetical protein
VFLFAALIGACVLAYVVTTVADVPADRLAAQDATGQASPRLPSLIGAMLGDAQLVKAMLFVGIAAKVAMTGVTLFALPVLMSRMDYAQEDIGQILMFYSGGVLISSQMATRLADRLGQTAPLLFWGTLASGAGLMLIGLMGWAPEGSAHATAIATGALIAGMLVLGLGHGLINAPIVTHIGSMPVAALLGRASTVAAYRFIERIGHVAGPVIVGQLLLAFGMAPMVISGIGVATILFGFAFIAAPKDRLAAAPSC